MNLPDGESAREAVNEILARSYYQLDPDSGADGAADRLIQALWQFLFWLLTPIRWLIEWIQQLPPIVSTLVTVLLILIVLALLFHIAYSLFRAVRSVKRAGAYQLSEDAEADPEELEIEALRRFDQGDPLTGIRMLYKACLLRIKQKDKNLLKKGMTNREHLMRLRRTPLFEPMQTLVITIDNKFYGEETCSSADFMQCQEAHARLVDSLKGIHVAGA